MSEDQDVHLLSGCDEPRPLADAALGLPKGVPPLRSLQLYLSNGCNLKCRHCWVNSKYLSGAPQPCDLMDIDLLRAAVAEARTLGLYRAVLTGGEPLLHPQFREVVEMLSAEGLFLCLVTNGTLLTRELAGWLKNCLTLTSINLSLDGADSKTHDEFRGIPGAFQAALRGLDLLADAGHKNLQVICCINRQNIHQADDLVALAEAHGATSVKFTPLGNKGRGAALHASQMGLCLEELTAFERHVRTELSKKTKLPLFVSLFPPAFLPQKELWKNNGVIGTCGVITNLGILGSGEISLCGIGRSVPDMVFGRLGEGRIRDIWLCHPRVLQLRRELLDVAGYPGICGDCIHAGACRTGCVANNYVDHSRLVWPSAFCAEAEERGLFPAARRKSSSR
ncbi:MAG: Radical protein [Euryarchaeota archaeon]|nr:Radical protein [Euryarchaeota archaeon]